MSVPHPSENVPIQPPGSWVKAIAVLGDIKIGVHPRSLAPTSCEQTSDYNTGNRAYLDSRLL
ncbi:hypothetical protein H6G96_01440 [Nostoc sp. FACHB-892]|uniref:hypothetical protein n=1 Tax=Nostoc sp. FACHB-892 TaxID=2692843 RepID=UPI0016868715|nr:hypothetical protein [Nostoc sp. FACHB-892]MBD2725019.1 hypothetical protein [Nostoc sp. FACHB-892]